MLFMPRPAISRRLTSGRTSRSKLRYVASKQFKGICTASYGYLCAEITEMQARAIFEAVVQVAKKGVKVIPEVMIPLIGGVKEFENQKKIVVAVAEEVLGKAGMKDLKYMVGTMIQ